MSRPRRPLPIISARPIGPVQRAQMKQAGRGSGTIDPTRTATSPATVQKLRGQFGDPGKAGYDLFSILGGKNLAAYVPGTRPPVGFRPSAKGTAVDVAMQVPFVRGGRAAKAAVEPITGLLEGSKELADLRRSLGMATEAPGQRGVRPLKWTKLSTHDKPVRMPWEPKRTPPAHEDQLMFPDYGVDFRTAKHADDPVHSGLIRGYGLHPGGYRWQHLQPKPKGKLPAQIPYPVKGLPRWRIPGT